jgi:hypothetical protein
MFQTLLESDAHEGERRVGWTLASALAHATIIASAIALTLPGARPEIASLIPTRMTYVAPRQVPRPGPVGSRSGHHGAIERIIREIPTVVTPVLPATDPLETIEEKLVPWPDSRGDTTARRGGQAGDGVFAAASVDRIVAPNERQRPA